VLILEWLLYLTKHPNTWTTAGVNQSRPSGLLASSLSTVNIKGRDSDCTDVTNQRKHCGQAGRVKESIFSLFEIQSRGGEVHVAIWNVKKGYILRLKLDTQVVTAVSLKLILAE
jgi:hypothetical protein